MIGVPITFEPLELLSAKFVGALSFVICLLSCQFMFSLFSNMKGDFAQPETNHNTHDKKNIKIDVLCLEVYFLEVMRSLQMPLLMSSS